MPFPDTLTLDLKFWQSFSNTVFYLPYLRLVYNFFQKSDYQYNIFLINAMYLIKKHKIKISKQIRSSNLRNLLCSAVVKFHYVAQSLAQCFSE